MFPINEEVSLLLLNNLGQNDKLYDTEENNLEKTIITESLNFFDSEKLLERRNRQKLILKGFICHEGEDNSGHYTVYLKLNEDPTNKFSRKSWFLFNDHKVTKIQKMGINHGGKIRIDSDRVCFLVYECV